MRLFLPFSQQLEGDFHYSDSDKPESPMESGNNMSCDNHTSDSSDSEDNNSQVVILSVHLILSYVIVYV